MSDVVYIKMDIAELDKIGKNIKFRSRIKEQLDIRYVIAEKQPSREHREKVERELEAGSSSSLST